MKAVILAAGVGKRLGAITKYIPKCMLKIGGFRLIDFHITLLMKMGVEPEDIYIIGGHRIEKLYYLKDRFNKINIILNDKYKKYNNVYSFYLIRTLIEKDEDFILINGDTLFHPTILYKIAKSTHTSFAIDNLKILGSEEMKVIIKQGRIIKFGKDIPPETANGEYIGIAKFRYVDAEKIFDIIKTNINDEKFMNIWYENAINYVLQDIHAIPIFTNGLPWIEIDTVADYLKAKSIGYEIINIRKP